METIKEQLERIVDAERETNNLIHTRLRPGQKVSEDVKRAKIDYVVRQLELGRDLIPSCKEADMSTNTYYRYADELGVARPKGNLQSKAAKSRWEKARGQAKAMRKEAGVRGPDRKRRVFYTEGQRAEIVKKAKVLLGTRKAVSLSHAASILGVGQSSLSIWMRKMDSKIYRQKKHDNGKVKVKPRHDFSRGVRGPAVEVANRDRFTRILEGIREHGQKLELMKRVDLENRLMRLFFDVMAP